MKLSSILLALAAVAPRPALADEAWLFGGELPGAVPLTAPQSDWFGPGGMPSLALYRSLSPKLLIGARLRAGLLLDGDAPSEMGYADPSTGGLGTLTAALRLRPAGRGPSYERGTGLWLEVAGGGASTGDLLRPTFEAGLGWGFAVGKVDIGPAFRYLQVVQPDDGLSGEDAKLALIGVEILFDRRGQPEQRRELVVAERPPAAPVDSDGDGLFDPDDRCPTDPEDKDGFQDEDGCPDADNDGDMIADKDDKCPTEAEVVNGVDDEDGCPDEGLFKVVEDRIVLEDRVLFETGHARVRTRARPILAAIIKFWKEHPEYERLIIEGHTDYRGTDNYNLKLSERRAKQVERELLKLGVDPKKMTHESLGETRPRAGGTDPESLEMNRRVEFVLVRQIKKPVTGDTPAPER